MDHKLDELIDFLDNNRLVGAPYTLLEQKRYYKIISAGAVYCFIVKEDFSNKHIGAVRKGDLLKPSSRNIPAKHPRGNLFNRDSWDKAFGAYSMLYLRG